MKATRNDLTNALVEVRKAYRILYAYQKRVLDTCSRIVDSLECEGEQLQPSYAWCYPESPRIGGTKDLLSFEALDLLPLKHASLFVTNTGDHSFSRKGNWLFEIRIVSDSDYSDLPEKEPANGFTFAPPESTDTYLMIYLWKRITKGTGDWGNDVLGKVDWPKAGKLITHHKVGAQVYGIRLEFADVDDEPSTEKTLREVAAKLTKQLNVQFNIRERSAD